MVPDHGLNETVGRSIDELPTPQLCVDLSAMERNLAAMSAFIREHGKLWRPHVKSHRSPPLVQRLVEGGAVGVTCATLDEAEQMAAAGIEPLLAYPTAGPAKVERLAALAERADPIAAFDHYAQIVAVAEACRRRGVECRVIVEVDIGMDRVGTRPGADANNLARAIDDLAGVRLVGLMGYEGHLLMIADPAEKRRRIEDAIGTLIHTAGRFERDGLSTEYVSAGGTGSYHITATLPGVTEIQAGGGIFGDPFYSNVCHVEGHEPALTILSTVVSRPAIDRAIVDAGRKSANGELHMPLVRGHADAVVTRLSAEHGVIQLGPESRDLRIGDRIELIVGYSDFTCLLHREIVGHRGGIVEGVFPIGGRGRSSSRDA